MTILLIAATSDMSVTWSTVETNVLYEDGGLYAARGEGTKIEDAVLDGSDCSVKAPTTSFVHAVVN